MKTLLERLRYRLRMLRLAWTLKPISGADGADEGGEGAGDEGQGAGSEGGEGGEGGESGGEGGSGSPSDEEAKVLRDELNRAKRRLSEIDKERKAAERKRAEDEGRINDVLKSVEQERDEAAAAKEEAELELRGFKNRIKVEGIASKLKFHKPDDAIRFISDEDAEGDEAHVERALRAAVKERPWLVNEGSGRTGGSVGDTPPPPAGKTPIRTLEDVKALSADEINERWEEVQAVMGQGAPT